jgi:uncharacterized membrane protein YbhN (UPF0104 family)
VRRTRAIALQFGVSAVALGAVVWWAARQPLPELPRASSALPALAGALGLYAVVTLLRAARWRTLLADGGVECTRGDALALTTVGYMGNNALPARAGDVLKAVFTARRAGAPSTGVFGVLVAERILDASALALVFAALVATLRLPIGVPEWVPVALGAGVALALGAAWLTGGRTVAGRRVRATVTALLGPSRRLCSRRGLALLGLSGTLWLVEGAVYAVLGKVAGVDLSLLEGLYVMALANVAALVPSGPGYIGTFDAAVLLGVSLVTAGAQPEAVAYVVLVRFVLFVPITLAGLAVLLGRYGGARQLAAVARSPRVAPSA